MWVRIDLFNKKKSDETDVCSDEDRFLPKKESAETWVCSDEAENC